MALSLSLLRDLSLSSLCFLLVSWNGSGSLGCTRSPAPRGWHINTCHCKTFAVSHRTVSMRIRVLEHDMRAWLPVIKPVLKLVSFSLISICQRTPELAGLPLAPCSIHRWQRAHIEYMWQMWKSLEMACQSLCYLQYHLTWLIKVSITLEGHTDLHVLVLVPWQLLCMGIKKKTQIHRPALRWYNESWVLLIQDNFQPTVASVYRFLVD